MRHNGGSTLVSAIWRLLGALHLRGFHAAVLAGIIMMPAVVAVGFLTDRLDSPRPPMADAAAAFQAAGLRGTFDAMSSPAEAPDTRF